MLVLNSSILFSWVLKWSLHSIWMLQLKKMLYCMADKEHFSYERVLACKMLFFMDLIIELINVALIMACISASLSNWNIRAVYRVCSLV